MNKKKKSPTQPDKILLVQFLEKKGITQYRLVKSIGVSYVRINKLVLGQRTISAYTAWRLGKFFIKSPEY
jgi:addiction module HigA family antidote